MRGFIVLLIVTLFITGFSLFNAYVSDSLINELRSSIKDIKESEYNTR